MRRLLYLLIDLALVLAATVLALALRENFELSVDRLEASQLYLIVTLLIAAGVFLISGIERSIWRLSGLGDYLRVLACTAVIVIATVAVSFVINRLDGVARALPVIQALTMAFLLIGARVLLRVRHTWRARQLPLSMHPLDLHQTVIVLGLNTLSELYLRAAAEASPHQLRIAGIVCSRNRHLGRRLREHKILGEPEQLDAILQTLAVHGVHVNKIVIAEPPDAFSAATRQGLVSIEQSTDIEVEYLSERLGFGVERVGGRTRGRQQKAAASSMDESTDENSGVNQSQSSVGNHTDFTAADLEFLAQRPYWRTKRLIDLALLACLAPVALILVPLVALAVAIDVGLPLLFWQERPGTRGRPFKLFKFRTMAPAHDRDGRRIADEARLSAIGAFLRRSRLDELPQLYNILAGEMSFIGPRPLLPVDQSIACLPARLLVRPGLTGWAQVIGGRHISAEDKAAIDIWYVANATLALDMKILLRTIPTLIFGEHIDDAATRVALQGPSWRSATPGANGPGAIGPSAIGPSAFGAGKLDGGQQHAA